VLRYHDYSVLRCGVEKLRDITGALAISPAAEAMQAFRDKLEPSVRDAVLKDLTPASRAAVEAQLVRSDEVPRSTETTHESDLGKRTLIQNTGARRILDLRNSLPRELWEIILGFTSPWISGLMLREERFNLIWYQIFRNDDWLDYVTKSDAHPGLDLTERNNSRRVVLLLHKQGNAPAAGSQAGLDWKDRFFKSLRGKPVELREHEFKVGKMTLNVRALFHDNLWGSLCSVYEDLDSYCYWTNKQRKLTTIETRHFARTYRGEVLGLKLPFVDRRTNGEDIPQFDLVLDESVPYSRRRNRRT
jgi:hypothetical protein